MEIPKNAIIACNTAICIECHACEASCKVTNNVAPGIKLRWVDSYWGGEYPYVDYFSRSIGCYHCDNAPCIEMCPPGALTRNPETKAVVTDMDKCEACQTCLSACPYGIPQYNADGKMVKCDLCFDITDPKDTPICVETCLSGALNLNRIRQSKNYT